MTAERVLLLNADYTVMASVSWRKAIGLLLEEKVQLVESYEGRHVRSPSVTMELPAVVAQRKYVKPPKKMKFNRQHVMARDNHTCQYCGLQPRRPNGEPKTEDLTFDHVVPRSRGVKGKVTLPDGRRVAVTGWENIVMACEPCNRVKANRTPNEAGMKLLSSPRKPTPEDIARMHLQKYRIPEEWKDYLPANSPWRNYWDAELDSE